jgi:hypothetical protein
MVEYESFDVLDLLKEHPQGLEWVPKDADR